MPTAGPARACTASSDPEDGEVYLYTQYEPADARRVFANFEQPDLKGPFTFSVTAPEGWTVLSNGTVDRVEPSGAGDGAATSHFVPTRPISTYITAVLAGPYHHESDLYRRALPDGSELEIPLGALCRKGLAKHFDAGDIFTVTKQGLDFFHDHFDYPYPFGKYDQAFVPEYNLGAMENPGCVTFREEFVFRGKVTQASYESRANVILHEMAHMWFGDLVTMEWWDDLWLKESFADFMGAFALVGATRFTDGWITFANRRKAWAYRADQLPSTHPVTADIRDLEDAKLNFDGITYAKGASVLKQLVAYVGQDAFLEGARRYFKRHAYGNTRLSDLLSVLGETSGRDMATWSRAVLVRRLLTESVRHGHCEATAVIAELNSARLLSRPHVVDAVDALLAEGRAIAEGRLYDMVRGTTCPSRCGMWSCGCPAGPPSAEWTPTGVSRRWRWRSTPGRRARTRRSGAAARPQARTPGAARDHGGARHPEEAPGDSGGAGRGGPYRPDRGGRPRPGLLCRGPAALTPRCPGAEAGHRAGHTRCGRLRIKIRLGIKIRLRTRDPGSGLRACAAAARCCGPSRHRPASGWRRAR
ncbi:hypothetical protein SANTM175S_08788 [Streptomyces antimycoticus]